MKGHRIIWTEEWDTYLKEEYPFHNNDYCHRELKLKGYPGSIWHMQEHATKELHLKKDPEWRKQEQQRCVRIMYEKRGADFQEKQRQRALHDPNWWGGRHNDGLKAPLEFMQQLALKAFNNPEARAKSIASRNKAIARDRRRVKLGLDPITRLTNIGNALTPKQKLCRYMMKYENGYIIFRGDQRIYYDENTTRSEQRERTAEDRGLHVYPISERQKFTV